MKRCSCTLKIRGGCERDSYGKRAGKGALVQWELSATLGVSQDQTLIVWETDEEETLCDIGASPKRFTDKDS